jgi:hypothetical protein
MASNERTFSIKAAIIGSIASLGNMFFWAAFVIFNPYSNTGYSAGTYILAVVMIGLAFLGIFASLKTKTFLMFLVFLGSALWGLYFLLTPGIFWWIGIFDFLYLVSAIVMILEKGLHAEDESSLEMQAWQRGIYWTITGALLGVSLITFIGLPFGLIGAALFLYGAVRLGPAGVWAALVGFGGLPAFFFFYDYLSVERCPPGHVLSIPAGAPPGTSVSCGDVPDSFLSFGLGFGAIALIGAVWGMSSLLRMRTAGNS